MDFVDEKHVAFFEAREKPGEFATGFVMIWKEMQRGASIRGP